MTSLPTRLTAEQVAEIVRDFKDESLGGPSRACLYVMVERLLAHVAALEGELAVVAGQRDYAIKSNAKNFDDLAACRRDAERILRRLRSEIVSQPADTEMTQKAVFRWQNLIDAALSTQAT